MHQSSPTWRLLLALAVLELGCGTDSSMSSKDAGGNDAGHVDAGDGDNCQVSLAAFCAREACPKIDEGGFQCPFGPAPIGNDCRAGQTVVRNTANGERIYHYDDRGNLIGVEGSSMTSRTCAGGSFVAGKKCGFARGMTGLWCHSACPPRQPDPYASFVSIEAPFPASATQLPTHWKGCRANGCVTADFPANPQSGTVMDGLPGRTGERISFELKVDYTNGGLHAHLRWELASATDAVSGEHYRFEITSDGGRRVVDIDEPVSFQRHEPFVCAAKPFAQAMITGSDEPDLSDAGMEDAGL
jgi:hypothetical protein